MRLIHRVHNTVAPAADNSQPLDFELIVKKVRKKAKNQIGVKSISRLWLFILSELKQFLENSTGQQKIIVTHLNDNPMC